MKRITFLLVVLLYCLVPQAQEEFFAGEIIIELINGPANWSLEVTVSTESAYWNANIYNSYHYLSDDYEGDTKTFTSLPDDKLGIGLCYTVSSAPFFIGLGKYKIEFKYDDITSYFYVDYRTSALPECASPCPDVNFDYNMGLKQFRQDGGSTSINGTTQNFWDHYIYCDKETEDLELYLTVSNQNNNPYLQWNAYNDPNILGYNIYRKITLGAGGSQTNVIFTTSTSFLDENFEIGSPKTPGYDQVEYWIKAKISSSQESLEGNHVQVVGTSIIQWKNSAEKSNNELHYSLNQNYPNPFNPVTTIEFTLEKSSIVSLRVFDILGREITSIINEMLEAGIHQVEFNGSDLESGIYFYEMQAGNFRDVKKFVLLK